MYQDCGYYLDICAREMKLSIDLLTCLEWASATGEALLCDLVMSLVYDDFYKWIMCLSFRVEAHDGGDPKVEASPRDIHWTCGNCGQHRAPNQLGWGILAKSIQICTKVKHWNDFGRLRNCRCSTSHTRSPCLCFWIDHNGSVWFMVIWLD
jgi:hypothetical protein